MKRFVATKLCLSKCHVVKTRNECSLHNTAIYMPKRFSSVKCQDVIATHQVETSYHHGPSDMRIINIIIIIIIICSSSSSSSMMINSISSNVINSITATNNTVSIRAQGDQSHVGTEERVEGHEEHDALEHL